MDEFPGSAGGSPAFSDEDEAARAPRFIMRDHSKA
jgi:hypothetical protein